MRSGCQRFSAEVGEETPHYTTISMVSNDRLSGIPADCIVRISPPLIVSRTKEISLQSFSWNATSLLINSVYNTIPLDEAGTTVLVTIPDGNWNLLSTSPNFLPPVIAAALTAASPGGLTYTVAYSALTGLLTISATGAFSILWETGPGDRGSYISYLLGFGIQRLAGDFGPAVSITSPSSANLSAGPAGFIIAMDPIFERNVYRTTNEITGTFFVPVNASSGVASFYYNVSNSASRLKTGSFSGIGAVSEIQVKIFPQHTEPRYPLDTLNDWKMVLLVSEGEVNL